MVMVKQQQDEIPTSQLHSWMRCHRGKPVHREVDGQLDYQSVKSHLFQADSNGAMRVQIGQVIMSCSSHTPFQSKIFLHQITIIVALLPGPQHLLKVKYQDFCQNDSTSSHSRTRKLTTSTLRTISSVTKTHRTL